MFIDQFNYFRFQTGISLESYQSKQEVTACLSKPGAKAIGRNKLAFNRRWVTVSEFLQFATSGHAFCNLYSYDENKKYWMQSSSTGKWREIYPEYKKGKNKGGMKLEFKTDAFAEGSQVIFVDVDFTRFSDVSDYLSCLRLPPTCVYMSFSDKIDKGGIISRRFRLVYIFDRILNPQEFSHISLVLTDRIVVDTGEAMEDKCGERISQYMNGVCGNPETYQSNYIYSVDDFPKKEIVRVDPQEPTAQNALTEWPTIIFDEQMLYQMGNWRYRDFMHYNSWRGYKYRTEKEEWIEGLYQLTDDHYLQIWHHPQKLVDGQHRRRNLFKNACLRRLMYPDMDPNTALFNLYVDFCRYIDNSDGAVTLDTLVRKIRNAFKKTPEQLMEYCNKEIEFWREHRPKFIVKHLKGRKVSRGLISKIERDINYRELDLLYNPQLSIQENIDRGIKVSRSTLYRYCRDRWIDPNPNKPTTEKEKRENARCEKLQRIEKFKTLYNPKLSERENKKILEQHSLSLAIGTINKWKKEYLDISQREGPSKVAFGECNVHYQVPTFNFKSNMPTPEDSLQAVVEESNPNLSKDEMREWAWSGGQNPFLTQNSFYKWAL